MCGFGFELKMLEPLKESYKQNQYSSCKTKNEQRIKAEGMILILFILNY